MTRKDWLLLSAALASADPRKGDGWTNWDELACACMMAQWECDCGLVAEAISEHSPAFDRARFLSDCGIKDVKE